MLSYVFLHGDFHSAEKDYGTEEFDNVKDLFGRIIALGTIALLRGGLCRSYVLKNDDFYAIKGKLNISGTIRNETRHLQTVNIDYEEMSADNIYNRIVKTALIFLTTDQDLNKEIGRRLQILLPYFSDVTTFPNPKMIEWKRIHFDINTKRYQTLLYVCRFLFDSLLINEEGGWKLSKVFDEQHFCDLYEGFLREFFRKEHRDIYHGRPVINWDLDPGETQDALPQMRTDLVLKKDKKVLIVDAKYYEDITCSRWGGIEKFHAANLYQIQSYVNNYSGSKRDSSLQVSGMLLYAKSGQSDYHFTRSIHGHKITVQTLDLNKNFEDIKNVLDQIATFESLF